MAEITDLVSYPVKGCAGVPLREAVLTDAGLEHDRTFMVVAPDGTSVTQRAFARMAVITAEVTAQGERLTLRAPEAEPIDVIVDTRAARRPVELFKRSYLGIDQGDAVASWLSDRLGTRCRLVRVPPEHDRVTTGLVPGTASYADSGALHVLSWSTLTALNERITEGGGYPVPFRRFRPNIVVTGWDMPHTEDRARTLVIGDAELGFAQKRIRCAVTTVDQESGERAGPEPLRTLATYRREHKRIVFGANYAVLRTGKLSIGDQVTVTSWGRPDD